MQDHNIESEDKDFTKLKTKGKVSSTQIPPNQYYFPQGPTDKTLVFESRFESGNLLIAFKVSDYEYDLVLQNDINTNGHTQWYFFRVSNTKPGMTVRFNIINLLKPDSLYNQGMRVLAYSSLKSKSENLGWHRIGTDIMYYQNNLKTQARDNGKRYYTLSFTHTFDRSNDTVYLSHCFPYTYSDLCEDLRDIEQRAGTSSFFNRQELTRTLAGNRCDYITITSKDKDPRSEKAVSKKGVFISARVHPGESNSSWVMKGLIDFLTSQEPEARVLRDCFVFKIVPMLNPDGVINGNYRCSLVGQDLNRRWKNASKTLHPENSAVKRLIRQFRKEREVVLYCDLHGHSRKKNIFMYGNNTQEAPHATRLFPYLMSKLCDFFCFEDCRFSNGQSKEQTARVTMWRELQIPNVFTMESSFCGAERGQLAGEHF